ncbi:MAG: prolyl oligopeptidase family serine peptidase [Acidobacteria bacterium]|nr:prolyl oligopeptidase family serine peptidase [Acidobacteriota bacterium]
MAWARVKTPTLILRGQDDWNVPLVNSEQLYQALRRLGVPTELVIYPGQGHGIRRPWRPHGPPRYSGSAGTPARRGSAAAFPSPT